MAHSPAAGETLYPISCKRCRDHKVKCNRILPQCSRCEERRSPCVYPERAKRRAFLDRHRARPPTSKNADAAPIQDLVERLKRVEEHCLELRSSGAPSNSENAQNGTPGPSRSRSSREHDPAWSISTTTDSTVEHSPARAACTDGSGTSSPNHFIEDALNPGPDSVVGVYLDQISLYSVLIEAVKETVTLNLRNCTGPAAISQEICIPKDLAKLWVNAYLEYLPDEMFPSLLSVDLLKMLPDILEQPHVHVDPVMLVIYYSALHNGALYLQRQGARHHGWPKKLYICCLRALPAWRLHATGTITDFFAAVVMMRTAMENYNEELSWRLFKMVCEFSNSLEMYQLVNTDAPLSSVLDKRILDRNRMDSWGLLQIDLFIQLAYDKPSTLVETMSQWNLELPSWPITEAISKKDAMLGIYFLLSSRLTFMLSEYFHLLNQTLSHDCLLSKVDALCGQIEDMYAEWNIDDWARDSNESYPLLSTSADISLLGYTSIILMLKKVTLRSSASSSMEAVDAQVATMPRVLKASRKIMSQAHYVLNQNPRSDVVSILFVGYQAHLSFTYIVQHLMTHRGGSIQSQDEDVKRLDAFSQILQKTAADFPEVRPLAAATRKIMSEVKSRLRGDHQKAATA